MTVDDANPCSFSASSQIRYHLAVDRIDVLTFTPYRSINTSMSIPSSRELIYAYRKLYRGLLHAVQYSKPARFTARDQLRDAFRENDPSTFNRERIDRTVEFLRLAAKEKGLEHKLVKNLLYTSWSRRQVYRW